MKDKLKLPIIVLVLVLIGVPAVLLIKNKKTGITTPLGSEQKQEITAEKLTTYNDSSGFKFDYPESLMVKDVSGSDQNIYSFLEISSTKQAGKTTIKIIDSPYDSLESFLKSKEVEGAGASRDLTLSLMPAKQIQFPAAKKIITVVIADGIEYLLESPLDNGSYWSKIHSQIVASFNIETQKSSTTGEDVGSDQAASEEEVIE